MNERLKELVIQVVGPARLHGGAFYLMGDDAIERFAKVVALEYARLAKNKSLDIVAKAEEYAADDNEMDNAKATAWQFKVFAQEIEEHFGLE